VLLMAVGCGQKPQGPPVAEPIEIRALFALTGTTSEIGVPYSRGFLDALRDVNADGGILGRRINYEMVDYRYDGPTAIALYEQWRSDAGTWAKVVSVFGSGTTGTVELVDTTAREQKPFISASYAATISSPAPIERKVTLPDGGFNEVRTKGAPYNFHAGTDYSTSIRIAIDFAIRRGAQNVAFAYCSGSYCTDPILAGKSFANQRGLANPGDQGSTPGDLRVELTDSQTQVDAKVRDFFALHPKTEWLWVGNTRKSAVAIIKAVHAIRPEVRIIVNVFGFDESMYDDCLEACVDRTESGGGAVYGVLPFAAFGDLAAPGMDEVLRIHAAYRRIDGEGAGLYNDVRYVQGFVSFLLWRMAAERVLAQDEALSGASIKTALETFSGVDTGGLTAPLTLSPGDHRPTAGARIYAINEFGKLAFQDRLSLTLLPEWLGW
jgi:branched-chain amino acid transport system substrate-binding protein